MTKWRTRAAFGAASVVALALVLAACGGGDDDLSGTVDVTMGSPEEYSLAPVPAEIPAGTIRFDVVNEGEIEHEMVVIETDLGAANLAGDDGDADEAGALEEVELDAGDSGDLTVDLEPGAYALVCNLPGHYAAGMYADFAVR